MRHPFFLLVCIMNVFLIFFLLYSIKQNRHFIYIYIYIYIFSLTSNILAANFFPISVLYVAEKRKKAQREM